MSEADKLFEELGYEKETYNPDVIYFTNKFIDTIYFAFNKNTKKVCFIENNQAGDISMQELQAINKKVEELRMDIEEQWREKTLKDIQEGKVIVAYVEKDKDGNTIVRLYTENMLERSFI